MRPLLIHPGLHKTATSWFQGVPFADESVFNSLLNHQEVDELITRPHRWEWTPDRARARLAAYRSEDSGALVDVISSEILTGNPFFGSRDVPEIAERLRQVVPDAKILLTVREQSQWLRSLYQQYVKRGGRLTFERFIEGETEPQYYGFNPISLNFHLFARTFGEQFGESNILVLPQELLGADIAGFFAELSSFLEVPEIAPKDAWRQRVGLSPPSGSEWLIRLSTSLRDVPLNRKSRTPMAWLGRLMERTAYRLPSLLRSSAPIPALPENIGSINEKLQHYCPVNLRSFGYYL